MNEIWENRLIAGTKTWQQVPASRKAAVKAVLEERLEAGEIDQETYDGILWE